MKPTRAFERYLKSKGLSGTTPKKSESKTPKKGESKTPKKSKSKKKKYNKTQSLHHNRAALDSLKQLMPPRLIMDRSKRNIHYHTVKCPICKTPVKLLWIPLDTSASLPMCKKCRDDDMAKSNRSIKSKYRVRFLPYIERKQDGSYEVHEGLSKNELALRTYLQYCLTPKECPNELKCFICSETKTLELLSQDLMRLNATFQNDIEQVTKIAWRILPPGEHPFESIKAHYSLLQKKNTKTQYDVKRLEAAYRLGSDHIYIGLDEFEGYVVFYFEKQRIAVLENPVVGNAVYLITGDWRTLSRYTKAELLNSHQSEVHRVIHRGDWYERLKETLY